jgi:soluble lytic murein transglycosylase-like protein
MMTTSLNGVEQRMRAIESKLGISSDELEINPLTQNDVPPSNTGASSFSSLLGDVMKDDKPSPPISSGINALKGSHLEPLVEQYAGKAGVSSSLVKAVIKAESGGNPHAISSAGAKGLMQLMPATAKGLGVNDPLNPAENIEGGSKYLGQLMKKYRGNKELALAAYNAGSGAVKKYGGVPPYKETQHYIKKVLKYEADLK